VTVDRLEQRFKLRSFAAKGAPQDDNLLVILAQEKCKGAEICSFCRVIHGRWCSA